MCLGVQDERTSNVSKETSSRRAPSGSLPQSHDKGQRGNQGSWLAADPDPLPSPAQTQLGSHRAPLPFSLPLRSGAPQIGLRPHSEPQQAARQGPALTCASGPGPQTPLPEPPLHPVGAQEAGFGAQRRASDCRGRKQSSLHDWCGFLLPQGSSLCFSSPPIRNFPDRPLRPLLPARTTARSDVQAEGIQPR